MIDTERIANIKKNTPFDIIYRCNDLNFNTVIMMTWYILYGFSESHSTKENDKRIHY